MIKKRKKILLVIAGVVFGIIILVGIHIYRNTHEDSALLDYIEDMGKEDTPKLVKAFSNRWNPWWYRQTAFAHMAAVVQDPAAVEPLIKILENRWESPRVRMEAAFTLGCIGDARAITPLIKALDYGTEWKYTALKSLTLIEAKDKRVCDIAKNLLNDESEVIRDLAIIALGAAGGEEEVNLLIGQLKNGDETERSNAVDALGKIGDKRAVEPLIERLENDTEHVARACCVSLGKIGDKRAVERLIMALSDKHRLLYVEAAIALGQIGDKRAAEPIVKEIKKQYHNKDGRNKLKEVYKTLTGHEYQDVSK